MDDGSLVRQMSGHERHVYNVAFHPDGKQLVSGDLMGNLFHWEVATGKLVRKLSVASLSKYDNTFKADIGGFRDLEFNADGKLLACAGITNVSNAFAGVGNPLVEIWDWDAGKQKIAHASKTKLRGVAWGVAFHPDGFTIGASGGGGGGYLLFWKLDKAEEFHQFKLPNTARDMDLSPDGLHLATAHHDGNVRISKMAAKA
jgi:WD40 repeat protein